MFQCLELLLFSCLFLTVESQQDQDLPLTHVNLVWKNGFETELSWEPQLQNCTYKGTSKTSEEYSDRAVLNLSNPWNKYFVMEGGFLNLTVQAVCIGKPIKQVERVVRHPELVKNLQCYVHAAKQAYCSWSPASPALDPKFFYRILPKPFSKSSNDKPSPVIIKECSSYNFTNGVRTGCNLDNIDTIDTIHVLFNGTLNNTAVWNTFEKHLLGNVRAPPLRWTVTQTGDKLNISWSRPDIPGPWKFQIKYTECEAQKTKDAQDENTVELDLVSHCPYCIRIRGIRSNGGGTEWSEETCFAANRDPAAWMYAAIIIPLLFAGLAVLIILCCRKNKEVIFPKVPKPVDLVSDISDNNNKITVRNLYIPAEEEENCKISLVTEP